MRVGVYKYNDPVHKTAWFRGFVYYYVKHNRIEKSCKNVYKTYADAEKDAKRLKKKEINDN